MAFSRGTMPRGELSEFTFSEGGIVHAVLARGSGPGVVLMHELPGMTPKCMELAGELAREFTVYLPLLFGKPGDYAPLRSFARLCIGREFKLFASGGGSPVADWLRALCRRVHRECGGPGLGVIGMCLTGNFAISLMADPAVLAPVASQPSLPIALSHSGRGALALSDAELRAAAARAQCGVALLGLRFSEDRLCPRERFASLRRALGSSFQAIEIDSSPGNAWGIPRRAHAVLTDEFVDRSGHPTRAARDAVLAFLRERLKGVRA